MRARHIPYQKSASVILLNRQVESRRSNFGDFSLVANSPGGCAYEREVIPPDWILDYWHPLEKAQYPEYFARREQRKKEYVMWWEKTYGKHDPTPHH